MSESTAAFSVTGRAVSLFAIAAPPKKKLKSQFAGGPLLGTRVPAVAVVRGEPGAGKSYAIDRFCASVPDARTLALAARGLSPAIELSGWASLLESLQIDPTTLPLAPL